MILLRVARPALDLCSVASVAVDGDVSSMDRSVAAAESAAVVSAAPDVAAAMLEPVLVTTAGRSAAEAGASAHGPE